MFLLFPCFFCFFFNILLFLLLLFLPSAHDTFFILYSVRYSAVHWLTCRRHEAAEACVFSTSNVLCTVLCCFNKAGSSSALSKFLLFTEVKSLCLCLSVFFLHLFLSLLFAFFLFFFLSLSDVLAHTDSSDVLCVSRNIFCYGFISESYYNLRFVYLNENKH